MHLQKCLTLGVHIKPRAMFSFPWLAGEPRRHILWWYYQRYLYIRSLDKPQNNTLHHSVGIFLLLHRLLLHTMGRNCHLQIQFRNFRICAWIRLPHMMNRWLRNQDSQIHSITNFYSFDLYISKKSYSHSTGLNWFRLGNIVHPVRSPFDYLIYPYYPAYHPFCYHFVISVDNKGGELQWIIALLFYQNNGQFQKVLRQWREKRPLRLSSSFFIPLSHRAVFFS